MGWGDVCLWCDYIKLFVSCLCGVWYRDQLLGFWGNFSNSMGESFRNSCVDYRSIIYHEHLGLAELAGFPQDDVSARSCGFSGADIQYSSAALTF